MVTISQDSQESFAKAGTCFILSLDLILTDDKGIHGNILSLLFYK